MNNGRYIIPLFFLLTSFAEFLQGVAVAWLAYEMTRSAFLVGMLNATVYLPGVVGGLIFRGCADSGNAAKLLSRTTLALFGASAILLSVKLMSQHDYLLIAWFFIFLAVLSLIRIFNKAYIGRVVRDYFPKEIGSLLMSRSTTASMLGGAIGAGVAGLLLDLISAIAVFALATVVYGLSFVAILLLGRILNRVGLHAEENHGDNNSKQTGSYLFLKKSSVLRSVLLFSVPSSGAMAAISTLLVPLAFSVAPDQASVFSFISISSMVGGLFGGLFLSVKSTNGQISLNYALFLGSIALVLLSIISSIIPTVSLVFILCFFLTSHIVAMQVLTNQVPPSGQVGQFVFIRNAFAGLSKVLFSLVAGSLVHAIGLQQSLIVLALTLIIFGLVWNKSPSKDELLEVLHAK